ncbi:UDP-N-acetylmuramoyl-L-alanyl-D-glutamate--2,6-diaminopimelate ligase, partial [Candidatus Pelagibacter bacterium]|nr:UDP-N-acetylmuramoyl-L-alanyl-D-glutamate--2,6-diaminopimelate ligase [Candidatus Pelagibacter bacterium]
KDVKQLDKNIFYKHENVNGRGDISKIKMFKKNIYLVDESYNSNPLSLRSALENFDSINVNNSKKHIILGDMLELGRHSKKLHIAISKNINDTSINNINVIGKYIKYTYKNLHNRKKGLILKSKLEIINLIKSNINNNDYLMIKGSNSTGLNKITNDIKAGKIYAL